MLYCGLIKSFCKCIISFIFPKITSTLLMRWRWCFTYIWLFFLEEFWTCITKCWLWWWWISSFHWYDQLYGLFI